MAGVSEGDRRDLIGTFLLSSADGRFEHTVKIEETEANRAREDSSKPIRTFRPPQQNPASNINRPLERARCGV